MKIGVIIAFFALVGLNAQESFVLPAAFHNSSIPKVNNPRASSSPYITGDSFRSLCQHHFDEMQIPLSVQHIRKGDMIYVSPGGLEYFFSQVHPLILEPYILITHNSDESFPGKFARFLGDEQLAYWATTNNIAPDHPKMISLPIGIANAYWPHGNCAVFDKVVNTDFQKRRLLTMNFLVHTRRDVRFPLSRYYKRKRFVHVARQSSFEPYLMTMKQSHFVLSPRGNGLDCHRTWEAILLGTIPIVEKSPLSTLFEDLPVLEVDNLFHIDKKMLLDQLAKIQSQTHHLEKAYFSYWKAILLGRQKAVRNDH